MAARDGVKSEVSTAIRETTSAYTQYEAASELAKNYRIEAQKWLDRAEAEEQRAEEAWERAQTKAEVLSERIQALKQVPAPEEEEETPIEEPPIDPGKEKI